MKKTIAIGAFAAVLLILLAWMISRFPSNQSYQVADDEIALLIQLDTAEDIGLLVIDYRSDDISGSGGISNADKSYLKHNEQLIYTLSANELDGGWQDASAQKILLQFTIITHYCDPNFENKYPVAYTRPAGSVSLDASFGLSYGITIRGDEASGYWAQLSN